MVKVIRLDWGCKKSENWGRGRWNVMIGKVMRSALNGQMNVQMSGQMSGQIDSSLLFGRFLCPVVVCSSPDRRRT